MITLVKGLPGTGKTKFLLNYVLRRRDAKNVLIVAPLRKLRDEIFERIANMKRLFKDERELLLVQAKDEELCLNWKELYDFINQIKIEYRLSEQLAWLFSNYFCNNLCPLRDRCFYYKQFKSIKETKSKIVVTTYKMAFPLLSMQKWDIVVFDEIETLLYILNDTYIHKSEFYRLPPYAQSILKKYLTEFEDYYVLTVNDINAEEVYVTTATPLRELLKVLKKETKIEEIDLTKRDHKKDIIIVVDPLYENTNHLRAYIVYNSLKAFREHFKQNQVGIVSPSKVWTETYSKMLEEFNYSYVNDLNGKDYRESYKKNVILTIKGKWYRGVNLGDKKIIIGVFQKQNPEEQFFIKNPWLKAFIDDLESFQEEIVLAENFQALFRVNRFRNKNHILIVDNEMYRSIFTFARWKYDERILVNEIPSLDL